MTGIAVRISQSEQNVSRIVLVDGTDIRKVSHFFVVLGTVHYRQSVADSSHYMQAVVDNSNTLNLNRVGFGAHCCWCCFVYVELSSHEWG